MQTISFSSILFYLCSDIFPLHVYPLLSLMLKINHACLQIELRSLEELDILNLDRLQKIWHDKFTADSFGNLKRLSVESCQKLEKVIPYNMSSLQIVKIVACNSVEEVFDLKIDNSEGSLALQLRELCLDNLKHLKCVWNKTPQGLVTYENLNRVKISGCPSFETPFPGYVMRSLLQVK